MRNIKIIVQYDGTNYCGWQSQTSQISIQETLEKAIRKVTGESASITGSGRTDAGVHALGQVANFHTASKLVIEKLLKAINFYLSKDIVIADIEEVPEAFHSRRDAKAKIYRYTIYTSSTRPVIGRQYVHHIRKSLDINAMEEAASRFIGTHDFTSFCNEAEMKENRVRTIHSVNVNRRHPCYDIDVQGNGFLYKMVRAMVGALIEVGKGNLTPDDITSIIEQKKRTSINPTAPAQGLCLVEVIY